MTKKLFGIDYILGGNYLKTLDHHPEGWAAGFLWNVDGVRGSKRAIEKLAASGKCPRIRVSLVWKDDHIFTERDIKIAIKRAKKLKLIIDKYPQIEWYVQPFLEPYGSNSLTFVTAREVELVYKSSVEIVIPFNNAFYPLEVHHDFSLGASIFSYDGLDYRDDLRYIIEAKGYDTFFLWQAECNGNKRGEKLPREQRTNWLKPKHIRQMVEAVEAVK